MKLKSLVGYSLANTNGLVKTLLIMKFTAVFILFACLQVSAKGHSQVSLSEKNAPLQKVLKKIGKQTGFDLLYSAELLQEAGKVTVNVNNVSLNEALKECFKNKNLSYSIIEKTIIIKAKNSAIEIPEIIAEIPPPLTISGVIVDEEGRPLVGVSVVVKGSTIGTSTDKNGKFVLNNVKDDAVLVFTSVNTEPYEISVGGKSNLGSIQLKTKITSGDEFVVKTGYQTVSKERATAAYGRVGADVLLKRPTTNIAEALDGQIAGLVSNDGTGFTIRGRSSLSNSIADRTPLLVVDGFPIEGGFTTLNPNDIQSVYVLKDAAASSIYGAKAANGVIIITTTSTGQKGRMNVSYNSFVRLGGKIDLDNYMNIADAATQIAYEDQVYNTFKNSNNSIYSDPYTQTNGNFRGARSPYATLLIERDKGNITQSEFDNQRSEMLNGNYKNDLEKYLLRNSLLQQHNLIISGTGEKNSYKFSALYENDLNNMQYNTNNKVLLGLTNIFNITDNIKYTFNTNLTFYNNKNNGVSLGQVKSVITPWTKLIDDQGNYTRMSYQNYEPYVQSAFEPNLPYSMQYNLLEEARLRDNTYKGQDLRIQNEFDFKIMDGLHFRPMFQYELFNDESISIYDQKSYAARNYANLASTLNTSTGKYISQIPQGGIYRKNSDNRRQSVKARAQIDFNRKIGSRHEVVALAGAEVISTRTEVNAPDIKFGYNKSGLNTALFDYATIRQDLFGNTILENSISYEGDLIYNFQASGFRQSYKYNERFIAGFLNASYTLDKKYTATVSARTDASNYVSKTVREKFSPFYSVGLRWNIANEDFMQNATFVDRLALRATYGVTGNAAGKTTAVALSVFTSTSASPETGNLSTGFITGRENDFLTWEKTYSTNIGTDFSFFKGRLSGSIDVYRRHSKDLFSSVLTSQYIQSTSSVALNLAEVMNKGFEISLNSRVISRKNFSWNTSINFDNNKNEVLKYRYNQTTLGYYLGSNSTFIEGLPTDRLMMVRLQGTTQAGFFIQENKDGTVLNAVNSSSVYSNFFSFGTSVVSAGANLKEDNRIYYQGRTTPPTTLGFTNTFNYKGFSLMTVITGRFGYKFVRTDEVLNYGLNSNNYSATGLASMQATHTADNTSTGNLFPMLGNITMLGSSNILRNYYSEVVVSDASHIRLNEIYLGYEFGGNTLSKMRNTFKSLTIYTQARNLGLLWKANDLGIDPAYPIGSVIPVKTITFGVRVGL